MVIQSLVSQFVAQNSTFTSAAKIDPVKDNETVSGKQTIQKLDNFHERKRIEASQEYRLCPQNSNTGREFLIILIIFGFSGERNTMSQRKV